MPSLSKRATCYLFNTDMRYRPAEGHEFMVKHGRVAAFCDRRCFVDDLAKGDVVFLYQSKVGIVGVGIADGRVRIGPATDLRNDRCEDQGMHWMKLDEYMPVDPPIPAKVIRKIIEDSAGMSIVFRRTCVPLSTGVGRTIQRLALSQQPKAAVPQRKQQRGLKK